MKVEGERFVELRNSVESLKTLLDVSSASCTRASSVTKEATSEVFPLKGDSASFSNAGSEISLSASASEIRSDKVAAIQAAVASGTYHVPAAAVAGKVVDAMLSGEQSSENRTGHE